MHNGLRQLSLLAYRVWRAWGSPLVRMSRLCHGIEVCGNGFFRIPGLLACNISFRAGGSGRAYHRAASVGRRPFVWGRATPNCINSPA